MSPLLRCEWWAPSWLQCIVWATKTHCHFCYGDTVWVNTMRLHWENVKNLLSLRGRMGCFCPIFGLLQGGVQYHSQNDRYR